MVRLIQPNECVCGSCNGGDKVPAGTFGGSHCLCRCHDKAIELACAEAVAQAKTECKERDGLIQALATERDRFGRLECEMTNEILDLRSRLAGTWNEKDLQRMIFNQEREIARLKEALRKIAIEPLGPSDASYKEVLQMAEEIAKEALAGGIE